MTAWRIVSNTSVGCKVADNDSQGQRAGGVSRFMNLYRFKIAGDDVVPCDRSGPLGGQPALFAAGGPSELPAGFAAEAMVLGGPVLGSGVQNKASLIKNYY